MGLKESGLRGSLRSVNTGVVAIPNSEADQKLAHRWVLNDVNGTVEDSIGGAEGANNGITSVAGDWAGDSAGEGDGNSHILTSTLGGFGSGMDSDFAVAFSIQTTDTDTPRILGVENVDDDTSFQTVIGNQGENEAEILLTDSVNNFTIVYGSTNVADGGQYRIVFNKTGGSAADIDIWVNQSEDDTTNAFDQGQTGFSDFDTELALFARNESGNVRNEINGVVDDICLFSDSLTQAEIESYNNPYS